MPQKLSRTELKKQLQRKSYDELVDLICRLYQSSPDAANILCAEYRDQAFTDEMMEESRRKIRKQFFFDKARNPSLVGAKKVISDFKKLKPPMDNLLELQVYYVECCTEFTEQYGDLYDSFYNSLQSMFATVVKNLNKEASPELFGKYYPRLKKIVDNLYDVGFGLYDDLLDILENDLEWEE